MDDKVFETLQKYDKQFRQIKDSNYCRLPGSPSLKILDECYKQIFGRNSKLLNGCSSCIYGCLKELSVVYFNEVDNRTEPKDVTNSVTTKKKVGRPKKATNKDK